jgi:SAM-dependent methyltransferase
MSSESEAPTTSDSLSLSQLDYFAEIAYRDPFHPVVAAYADPKIEFLWTQIPLAGEILDVGCGNGIFTHRLAAKGASVTGLDLSPQLLAGNSHARLIRGDATGLPFPSESFDISFEANLLHHVADRTGVIREMARVSRRYVVLLEPNRNNPVMFGFGIVVKEERGLLVSTSDYLHDELKSAELRVISSLTTGLISQNNTPEVLIPLLRKFDRPISWGEYIVLIAEKIR